VKPDVTQTILADREIAYVLTDRALNVLDIRGAVEILGDGKPAALGQSLPELVPELVGSEDLLHQVMSGTLPRFELALLNRDTNTGDTRYLSMVTLPTYGEAGYISGLVHVVEDVTEMGALQQRLAQHRNELRLLQRELEQRNQDLQAANAELRRLDELKSIFVSVAAHELRTPLTSILGYLEVLLDGDAGDLSAGQRDYLDVVQSSALRLQRITSELLDVTRIESGRVELVLQPTDLRAVVQAVIREHKPQLDTKGLHLAWEPPRKLPAALVDRTRAAQIVGNLLSNAIKYTPEGGQIIVALSVSGNTGFLKLSVTDTGVGIAEEDQAKLFARFFRGESANLTGAEGAGMGLYITRSLVELHGGRIWLESVPLKGSTFCATLPAVDDSLDSAPAEGTTQGS